MFKINATSGTSAMHHSNEDEDGGSDIESFTNRILRLADEQKQSKTGYEKIDHAGPVQF